MPKQAGKIDLFQQHKAEYVTPKHPVLIEVGTARYLAVDGEGEPGEAVFQERLGALYGVAYTCKFASKLGGHDYTVGKLEALWGVQGQSREDLERLPPSRWKWTMLSRVPELVSATDLERACTTLREKGKQGEFEAVRLEAIEEGTCVQVLHVGPYENEPQTVAQMLAFAASEGWAPHRWHHEIYLSDPRRVPPERLRTILRQPVRRA